MYSIANKRPGKPGDILIAFIRRWKVGVTEILLFKELFLLWKRSIIVEWVSSISSLNAKQSYLTFLGYSKLILLRFTELSAGKRKTLALFNTMIEYSFLCLIRLKSPWWCVTLGGKELCWHFAITVSLIINIILFISFSAVTKAFCDYADKNPRIVWFF